jgi:hypothetical protein
LSSSSHWHWKLTQEPLQQIEGLVEAQEPPAARQVWHVPAWQEVPEVQAELLEQLVGQPVAVPSHR